MEIQNASTTHSTFNQLRNVKAVRFDSKNVTNSSGEIDNGNINTANIFYIQIKERNFFVWSIGFPRLKFR